jgi:hypothetical protein
MILIYAAGQSRHLDLATTSEHRLLPSGAKLLTTVEGERTTSHLGQETFSRMTDEEYYELQELINDALRQSQAARTESCRD